MICPNCKCEYIHGVTQCAECGVPLVDELESPQANFPEDIRLIPIWRGKDNAECERVIEALESAGIPHTDPNSKSFFSFLPTDPNTEIWVSAADQERARKILLDLEGLVYPEDLTSGEIESFALPESDRPDGDEQSSPPVVHSENWHDDDPVSEVWRGESEEIADGLVACLREIGIVSRKLSEPGHWRLVVQPDHEARAKEVVREVVEATPPE
jgi:hypothetical protein